MPKSIIIGITGRTGSGKSLACEWIKTHIDNVEHIDCDEVGHQVLEQPDIKQQLIEHFGDSIIKNNTVNRPTLGNIVFNDKDKLSQLNDIVHPQICTEVNKIIGNTSNHTIIIEGALIHQVGLEHLCNTTICVDAPPKKLSNAAITKILFNQTTQGKRLHQHVYLYYQKQHHH